MFLGNLKYDRNIHTEIEDICTIHLISIVALGDERITAASPLRKDCIFASEVWISNLGCQKRIQKRKTICKE